MSLRNYFANKSKKERVSILFRYAALLAFIGCVAVILIESLIPGAQSKDQSDAVGNLVDITVNKQIPPTDLELSVFSGETFYVGDSVTLSLSFTPKNASFQEATFTVSDPTKAEVTSMGVVTFLAEGEVTVEAVSVYSTEIRDSVTLQVLPVRVESVKLSVKSGDASGMQVGKSITLSTEVLPENATYPGVKYTSLNPAVATVAANGTVKAVALGEAVIRVESLDNPAAYAETTVFVTQAEEERLLLVNESGKTYNCSYSFHYTQNGTLGVYAKIVPNGVGERTVEWEVSCSGDFTYQIVENHVEIFYSGTGSAFVRATCGSLSESLNVTAVVVTQEDVVPTLIAAQDLFLYTGETGHITYSVLGEGGKVATFQQVVFGSADPTVAFVDNGKVVAVKAGETDITITSTYDAQVYKTVHVTVADRLVEKLSLLLPFEDQNRTLLVGQKLDLITKMEPSNPTDPTLVYASLQPEIVSVDETGRIVALKSGTAMVTVQSVNGIIGRIVLHVSDIYDLVGLQASGFILGEDLQVTLTQNAGGKIFAVFGDAATSTSVQFASSNPEILDVKESGTVTALKKGEAEVYVTYGQTVLTIRVTVESQKLSDIIADWSRLVRKGLGHFTVFVITGIFGTLAAFLFLSGKKRWFAPVISAALGYIVAALSENLQYFTEGRGPSFADVGLDFQGYSLAILLVSLIFLILLLIRWIQKKRKTKK